MFLFWLCFPKNYESDYAAVKSIVRNCFTKLNEISTEGKARSALYKVADTAENISK